MCKERRKNFCPACDRYMPADEFTLLNQDPRPRCPACTCLLAPGEPAAFGSPSQLLSAGVLGALARYLISAGLLDGLEQRAREESPSDETAAFLYARILLREAARL